MINNYCLDVESLTFLPAQLRHEILAVFSKVQCSEVNTDEWKQNYKFLEDKGLIKKLEPKGSKLPGTTEYKK